VSVQSRERTEYTSSLKAEEKQSTQRNRDDNEMATEMGIYIEKERISEDFVSGMR